jgi:hypothetical protein
LVERLTLKTAEMDEDCCKTGFKRNGDLVDQEGTLDKNNSYMTGKNKHAAVLIIHDRFGWTVVVVRYGI